MSTWENINWIGEGCDRLGKPSLTSLGDYHWANARIRVNSSSVKGVIISSSLFCSRQIQYCQWHRGMAVQGERQWRDTVSPICRIFSQLICQGNCQVNCVLELLVMYLLILKILWKVYNLFLIYAFQVSKFPSFQVSMFPIFHVSKFPSFQIS